MRVVFQIGSRRNAKMNQILEAYVNEEKVNWSSNSGMFLTTQKDRKHKGEIWFMYEADVSEGDIIVLRCKTFISGVGPDESLTFESVYNCREDCEIKSVDMVGVGWKGYPVIKGKISEIASVSEADLRRQNIDDFLNKDF